MDPNGWLGVLLDGVLGTVIATVVSVMVALLVINRQTKHERTLADDEKRVNTLLTLLSSCNDLSRDVQNLLKLLETEGPAHFNDIQSMYTRAAFMDALGRSLGSAVGDSTHLTFVNVAQLGSIATHAARNDERNRLIIATVNSLHSLMDDIGQELGASEKP
jgi:uncharacterized protein (DUF1501 family)